MPETQTPPADGTTGTTGGTPEVGDTNPATGKTFTQAEVDALISQRLARAKPDPELARKAAEYDRIQQEGQSELEREKTKAAQAEQKAKAAIETAQRMLRRAAIMDHATRQNAADAEVVAALLEADESVTVAEDGTVSGADEAVKQLLKQKKFLVTAEAPAPPTSGGDFGGGTAKTLDQQIAEAEANKDWALAGRLKMRKLQPA